MEDEKYGKICVILNKCLLQNYLNNVCVLCIQASYVLFSSVLKIMSLRVYDHKYVKFLICVSPCIFTKY